METLETNVTAPSPQMSLPLSIAEDLYLGRCEAVIREGLHTFVAVGDALAAIRDGRLYRATHATFEAYAQDKWSISRSQAYRWVSAAETYHQIEQAAPVSPIGDMPILPANEAQARPLNTLPEEQRPEAWAQAVEQAGGQPTAADVQAVVEEMLPPKTEPVKPAPAAVSELFDEEESDEPSQAAPRETYPAAGAGTAAETQQSPGQSEATSEGEPGALVSVSADDAPNAPAPAPSGHQGSAVGVQSPPAQRQSLGDAAVKAPTAAIPSPASGFPPLSQYRDRVIITPSMPLPEGCTADCPCRLMTDNHGQATVICADPTRLNRILADEKAAKVHPDAPNCSVRWNEEERADFETNLPALTTTRTMLASVPAGGVDMAEVGTPYAKALAVVTKALFVDTRDSIIRDAIQSLSLPLNMDMVIAEDEAEVGPILAALSSLPARDLLRLCVECVLRTEIDSLGYEVHPEYLRFLTPAASSDIDFTEDEPALPEVAEETVAKVPQAAPELPQYAIGQRVEVTYQVQDVLGKFTSAPWWIATATVCRDDGGDAPVWVKEDGEVFKVKRFRYQVRAVPEDATEPEPASDEPATDTLPDDWQYPAPQGMSILSMDAKFCPKCDRRLTGDGDPCPDCEGGS